MLELGTNAVQVINTAKNMQNVLNIISANKKIVTGIEHLSISLNSITL